MAMEIPKNLERIVKNAYKNNTMHIKVVNPLTSSFKTSKGALQRCPTSPTPFKIFHKIFLRVGSENTKEYECLGGMNTYTTCVLQITRRL